VAEKLLDLPESGRNDFIKKLLDKDDFNLANLLDSMILVLAARRLDNPVKIKRWHKFLRLRHEAAYFNLNPRLQLQNLLN